MIDISYLYKGLCGLARAHKSNTMTGHLGAAVATGYFFAEDHPDLDKEVYQGIEEELKRIIRGEEKIWFDPEKAGITIAELFEPFPEEKPQPERLASLAQALSANIDQTRQSGHNVIFTAIALRALQNRPNYATPSIIDGIRTLTEGFNGAAAGRAYYGEAQGWRESDQITLPPAEDGEAYPDITTMVDVVSDTLIQMAGSRRQGVGGLTHVINHANALVELDRLGYHSLAREGLAAHKYHLRLWRSLPDLSDELGSPSPAEHDPRAAAYWTSGTLRRDTAQLTHRIKLLYGFHSLAPLIKPTKKRQQAEVKLRYLLA